MTNFLLLIIWSVAWGQIGTESYKVHHCKENKLMISVNEIYKYSLDIAKDGHQDLFTIMNPDSSVKYRINIIRTKSPITDYEYLKSEEYRSRVYIRENQTIEEYREVNYPSLKGVRFLKKTVTPQRVFLSYSISTLVNEDFLLITYNATEDNFYKYEEEFIHSVNSINFE